MIDNMPAQPTVREIEHYGKSVEDLLREGLFPKTHTLLSLRTGYHDLSTGIRASVHNRFGYGERVADVVDTTEARELPNGFLRLAYIQQPDDIVSEIRRKSSVRKGELADVNQIVVEGGERIAYECPPDGYAAPGDGLLWHPQTGAAIATVANLDEARRQVKAYIEAHHEQFKEWNIPEPTVSLWKRQLGSEFEKVFGRDFDPKNPNPEQLAIAEISYQLRPNANSGVGAVGRGFWYHGRGPFDVHLRGVLGRGDDLVGARPRK